MPNIWLFCVEGCGYKYRRTPKIAERWNSALLGWEEWLTPRHMPLPRHVIVLTRQIWYFCGASRGEPQYLERLSAAPLRPSIPLPTSSLTPPLNLLSVLCPLPLPFSFPSPFLSILMHWRCQDFFLPRRRKLRPEVRGQQGRERGRVLGERRQPPTLQLGGLGSAVSCPSRVRGGAPAAKSRKYFRVPESAYYFILPNDIHAFRVLKLTYLQAV